MENQNFIPAALAAKINALPPVLSISQLADIFQLQTPTLRKRIERGSCPVTIRQIEGGNQYVLLKDVLIFIGNGIPQNQKPLVKRAARNPFGRLGKEKRGRGRPSHAEVAARNLAPTGNSTGAVERI